MAAGTKLVLKFEDNEGKTVQFTYNYAKPSMSTANVAALASGMVTNTAIYSKTLVAVKSAMKVTTTETPYDLSTLLNRSIYHPDVEVINATPEPEDPEPGDEVTTIPVR